MNVSFDTVSSYNEASELGKSETDFVPFRRTRLVLGEKEKATFESMNDLVTFVLLRLLSSY